MENRKEVRAGEGTLLLEETGDGLQLCGVKGNIKKLVVPDMVEGLAVTSVGKKALLSNKEVTEVSLPDTLKEIGDWAFAHCSSLKRVRLPDQRLQIGKGIFKDCGQLALVDTGKDEDTARLLAAALVLFGAEYLFDLKEAGSREWLEKWDSRMDSFLLQKDEAGFTKMILCGEEDLLADLPEYIAERRRAKARVCFLRLLYPRGLSEERGKFLKEYLGSHAKGCESEAAWEVVLREHGDERSYYEMLTECGGVHAQNLPDMLQDMKEGHTEMKAYLMRCTKDTKEDDFFSALLL